MRALVARLDNDGDVLLAGPAVRAVGATADHVVLWCGARGRGAADLLPGVDEVVEHTAAWIDPDNLPLDRAATSAFLDDLRGRAIDVALVLTSFHQSPLPAAMLLRLAGVERIGAVCDDYPGTLLDVRHRVDDDLHEVERSLSLAAAMGFRLPAGDHGRLAVRDTGATTPLPAHSSYLVVHPGATVPARTWSPARWRDLVTALTADGWPVVVTGAPGEKALADEVSDGNDDVTVLAGRTSLAELAVVLRGAAAVAVGNTGPAHLAAAVGTPVLSVFAPTVPAARWRPWGVPHTLVGHQDIACAGCRASTCPLPGQPCLDIDTAAAVDALRRLLSDRDRTTRPPAVASGVLPQDPG